MGTKSRRKRQFEHLKIEKVLVEHPTGSLVPKFTTARTPAAWMSARQVEGLLAAEGPHQDVEALRVHIERCKTSLSARPTGIDQSAALFPVPHQLDQYVEQLWASPVGQLYRSLGYELRLIDLKKIAGFQTAVRVRSGERLAARARNGDLVSIARVALPFEISQELNVSYDAARRSWTISAHDPNLRFGAPLQPNETAHLGFLAVGFRIDLPASLMQVQTYRQRHFLSDGYHRAVGLLRCGIRSVPALYREINALEDLGAMGHLPIDAITGDRPPLLGDYLDPAFSVEIHVPEAPRRLLIQATELS